MTIANLFQQLKDIIFPRKNHVAKSNKAFIKEEKNKPKANPIPIKKTNLQRDRAKKASSIAKKKAIQAKQRDKQPTS